MKYMLILRSTEAARKEYEKANILEIIEQMGAYNEGLMKAGVLLASDGLADSMADNFVVDFSTETPTVTDGPYGETHELFSGYWVIETASKEEAVQWASRCPLGPGAKLEVRRVNELSDLAELADSPPLKKQEEDRAAQLSQK